MTVSLFMAFLFITSMPLSSCAGDTFDIELPRNITALRGSCVQIPCSYNVSNFQEKLKNTRRIFGIWLKTTHGTTGWIFNSSTPIIKGFSHIEMVGNLSRRECTTVFYDVIKNHSDVYYFRLEMEPNKFKATFLNSAVNINVLDVLNPPELDDLKEVKEGTEVSVRCSAEAPCPKQPPTLSWSYIPTSANVTTNFQEKPDKTQTVMSTMTFNASYILHKKNIICAATYPRNNSNHITVEKNVTLQVLFSPKETHIIAEPNTSVSVGTNVTFTCKSKANPSHDMNFTWYKRKEQKLLASGERMTFNVSRIHEGWYFCRAENKHGVQTSEDIQLIVEGPTSGSLESISPLVAGCVGGVLAFLLLGLLVLIFTRKHRTQSSIVEADLSEQDQNKDVPVYTNIAFVSNEQPEILKDESDTIHYGEIHFSTFETKCHTERSSGQETVYAEVCHESGLVNTEKK